MKDWVIFSVECWIISDNPSETYGDRAGGAGCGDGASDAEPGGGASVGAVGWRHTQCGGYGHGRAASDGEEMHRAGVAHRIGCRAVAKRNLHSESGDGTGHVHLEIGEGVTRLIVAMNACE